MRVSQEPRHQERIQLCKTEQESSIQLTEEVGWGRSSEQKSPREGVGWVEGCTKGSLESGSPLQAKPPLSLPLFLSYLKGLQFCQCLKGHQAQSCSSEILMGEKRKEGLQVGHLLDLYTNNQVIECKSCKRPFQSSRAVVSKIFQHIFI